MERSHDRSDTPPEVRPSVGSDACGPVTNALQLAETLNRINEILRTALAPQEVLARLVGEASEAAGADRCLVIEVDGDHYAITHVRGVRPDLVGQRKTAEFFPAFALTADNRRPVLIGDNWSDSRTNPQFVVAYGLRSFMLLPLVVDGEVFGVLALVYDEPREYGDEDARFADRLALAMSLAMANAARYESEVEALEALKVSEERVRRKLDAITLPSGDIGSLDLEDVIDVPGLQAMMNDFYELAHFPVAIIDLQGKVLVGTGWQEICTRFHRVDPETCELCIESDIELSSGVAVGEFKLYKCKNGMWDVATPLTVGGRHVGNVFSGQFFFDDEDVDREFFAAQAKRYGFDEVEYLAALDAVPRFSRDMVRTGMAFYTKLTHTVSQLSFSTIQLARAAAQREEYLARLFRLLEASTDILAAGGIGEMSQRICDAARDLIGARYATLGHEFADGRFVSGAVSAAPGADPCPQSGDFSVDRGGTYLDLMDGVGSVRYTDAQMRSHPRWRGLPEGHAPLRGLLGASLANSAELSTGMILLSDRNEGDFTEEDELLLRQLASMASLALENARLYEHERRIADTLQEAILTPPARITGIETSYLYRPASNSANVGGDYYDVFQLDERHVGIVIGDISGKGIEAARLTSLLRDGIRAYALETLDPALVLGRVNTLVNRSVPAGSFSTVFYGVLDVPTGELQYCGAGHPPPVITGRGQETILETRSPVLGAFPDLDFTCGGEARLQTGDVLVLYTDGVTEARNGSDLFGEERLLASLGVLRDTPALELPQALLDEVLAFSGGSLRDDTVILAVQRTADDESEAAS